MQKKLNDVNPSGVRELTKVFDSVLKVLSEREASITSLHVLEAFEICSAAIFDISSDKMAQTQLRINFTTYNKLNESSL